MGEKMTLVVRGDLMKELVMMFVDVGEFDTIVSFLNSQRNPLGTKIRGWEF